MVPRSTTEDDSFLHIMLACSFTMQEVAPSMENQWICAYQQFLILNSSQCNELAMQLICFLAHRGKAKCCSRNIVVIH